MRSSERTALGATFALSLLAAACTNTATAGGGGDTLSCHRTRRWREGERAVHREPELEPGSRRPEHRRRSRPPVLRRRELRQRGLVPDRVRGHRTGGRTLARPAHDRGVAPARRPLGRRTDRDDHRYGHRRRRGLEHLAEHGADQPHRERWLRVLIGSSATGAAPGGFMRPCTSPRSRCWPPGCGCSAARRGTRASCLGSPASRTRGCTSGWAGDSRRSSPWGSWPACARSRRSCERPSGTTAATVGGSSGGRRRYSRAGSARHEGKWDPGQRIANLVIVVGLLVLIVTGVGLATLHGGPVFAVMAKVHKWTAILLTPVLLGHIVVAAGVLPGYRGVWRSMHLGGRLRPETADRLWPAWSDRASSAAPSEASHPSAQPSDGPAGASAPS